MAPAFKLYAAATFLTEHPKFNPRFAGASKNVVGYRRGNSEVVAKPLVEGSLELSDTTSGEKESTANDIGETDRFCDSGTCSYDDVDTKSVLYPEMSFQRASDTRPRGAKRMKCEEAAADSASEMRLAIERAREQSERSAKEMRGRMQNSMHVICDFLLASVLKEGQERDEIVRKMLAEHISNAKLAEEKCERVNNRRVNSENENNALQSSGSDLTTLERPIDEVLDRLDA
jgi:hypothetical protein